MKYVSLILVCTACTPAVIEKTAMNISVEHPFHSVAAEVDNAIIFTKQELLKNDVALAEDKLEPSVRFTYTDIFSASCESGTCNGVTIGDRIVVKVRSGCMAENSLVHELMHYYPAHEDPDHTHYERWGQMVDNVNAKLEALYCD